MQTLGNPSAEMAIGFYPSLDQYHHGNEESKNEIHPSPDKKSYKSHILSSESLAGKTQRDHSYTNQQHFSK